jgi:hypothetical protein
MDNLGLKQLEYVAFLTEFTRHFGARQSALVKLSSLMDTLSMVCARESNAPNTKNFPEI